MLKGTVFVLATLILASTTQIAHGKYYGRNLCKQSSFKCVQVEDGTTWADLFPDPRNREIVKRLNRTNMPLHHRNWIVVPENLGYVSYLELAPFSQSRNTNGRRLVLVDLSDMAFAAYSKEGELLHWGPISGGRGWCPDVRRGCPTAKGKYRIYTRKSKHHVSSIYPIETNGGAPMPYAMHYYRGYALHGSPTVPGYHASHGCIRLFVEDARWLNKQFVEVGTPIIVRR